MYSKSDANVANDNDVQILFAATVVTRRYRYVTSEQDHLDLCEQLQGSVPPKAKSRSLLIRYDLYEDKAKCAERSLACTGFRARAPQRAEKRDARTRVSWNTQGCRGPTCFVRACIQKVCEPRGGSPFVLTWGTKGANSRSGLPRDLAS